MATPTVPPSYRVGQHLRINDRLTVKVLRVRDDGNTIDMDFETVEIRMTRAEYDALTERAKANLAGVAVIVEEASA